MCKALQWLWQEDELKQELDDMQKERESTLGEKAKTVKDVLTSRCVRWQLLTLAIPCAGVQFCGINAVSSFQFSPPQHEHEHEHEHEHVHSCMTELCLTFHCLLQLYFYAFDIFRESGVPEDQMHYLSIGIGATELITVTLCVSVSFSKITLKIS